MINLFIKKNTIQYAIFIIKFCTILKKEPILGHVKNYQTV